LVNQNGGGATFAGLNARFVALAFILRKMQSGMVNAALLFAWRMNFSRNPNSQPPIKPRGRLVRISIRNAALIAAAIQGLG
jgi:hypothetical protein